MNNDIADGLGLPPPPPPPPTPTPEPVSSGLPPLEPIAPPPPSPEANEPLAQKADQPLAETAVPVPPVILADAGIHSNRFPIPEEVLGTGESGMTEEEKPKEESPKKKVDKKLVFGGTLVLLLLGGALALAAQLGLFRGDLRQRASGGCPDGQHNSCYTFVDHNKYCDPTNSCDSYSRCECVADEAPAATEAPAPPSTGGGGSCSEGVTGLGGCCAAGKIEETVRRSDCSTYTRCERSWSDCGTAAPVVTSAPAATTAPAPTTASGTGGGGGGGNACSGPYNHSCCGGKNNGDTVVCGGVTGTCSFNQGTNCQWTYGGACTAGACEASGTGSRKCNSEGSGWTYFTGANCQNAATGGGSTPTVAPQNYNSCTTLGDPCTTDTGTGNCRATGAQNGSMYCQVTITSTSGGTGGSCTANGKTGVCTDQGSCSGDLYANDNQCGGVNDSGIDYDCCVSGGTGGTGGSCTANGKTGVCMGGGSTCNGSLVADVLCNSSLFTRGYCCVASSAPYSCPNGSSCYGGQCPSNLVDQGVACGTSAGSGRCCASANAGLCRSTSNCYGGTSCPTGLTKDSSPYDTCGTSAGSGVCCTPTYSPPTPTGTATCTCDFCQKIGSSGPATCTGGIKQASRSNCASSASLCAATPTPGGPPSCPGLGGEGLVCRVPQNCNNAPNCDGGLICDGGICVKPPPGTCGSGPSGCRVHNCSVCSNYGGGLDECRSGGTVTDCASAKLSGSCGQIDLLDAEGSYCGVMQQACTGSCAGGVTTMAGGGAPAAGGGEQPAVDGGTQSPPPGADQPLAGTGVPPGGTAGACVATRLYLNGNTTPATAAQIASLQIGNTIRLAVRGNLASFTKGRFVIKLNSSVLTTQETTTKQNLPGDPATFEFIYDQTITQGGNYSIEGSIWQ